MKLFFYIGLVLLGWLAGVAIRCKEDAEAWGDDFLDVFQDRIMRILGL